jgi:hypothetical protein
MEVGKSSLRLPSDNDNKPLRCKVRSIYSMDLVEGASQTWIFTCSIYVTEGLTAPY